MVPVLTIANVFHANPFCDAQRGNVADVDVRDDAVKPDSIKSVLNDWAGSFRCEAVSPSGLIKTPTDFNFGADAIIGD